jgi:hypothetical protein
MASEPPHIRVGDESLKRDDFYMLGAPQILGQPTPNVKPEVDPEVKTIFGRQ